MKSWTKNPGARVFGTVNAIVLFGLALLTIYPFWDSFIVAMSSVPSYLASPIHLYPRGGVNLAAYAFILRLPQVWTSYGVTLFVTVVGTALSLTLTVLGGYVLAKRFRGRYLILFLIVFTMYFNGGIIPNYIIVRNLGLLNSLWALILPTAINTYYLIVMRSFFANIPGSLEDAAKIDGCSEFGTLIRVVLPISKPALAAIGLFYAVGYWNAFFNAVMYITDPHKWPLQIFLRSMLYEDAAAQYSGSADPFSFGMPTKMAVIMVATIPIVCVYPFFQRHFTKGVLLGAVKE
jgi:putative aldouronate transport system permease protein